MTDNVGLRSAVSSGLGEGSGPQFRKSCPGAVPEAEDSKRR